MNSVCIFVLLASICIVQLSSVRSSQQSNPDKFLGKYPIPSKTPGSIDIDTNETKKAFLKPFKFFGGLDERVEVVNTGQSVEVRLNQTSTKSKITGGPLFQNEYKFAKGEFYWTNNVTGVAHTTIDGQGAPLVAVFYFYNTKYGSFDNAINHRDGLGQVNLPVKIGGTPNLLFIEFAKILKKIRKPGSQAGTYLANSFEWYDFVLPTTIYYAYPGSYTDEKTRHTYYCTTTIAYPVSATLMISVEQFKDTFESLLDSNRKPLSNIDKPQSSKAQIVQVFGTLQFPILTGKSLPRNYTKLKSLDFQF